jgi:predicted RNA-binding protein Jag
MKSVVQEASSVAKAVDAGWRKADKPNEFRVQIMEEGKSGFLGFNSEPSKVVIYFDDAPVQKPREQAQRNKRRRTTTTSKEAVVNNEQTTARRTRKPAPAKEVEPKKAEKVAKPQLRQVTPKSKPELKPTADKPEKVVAKETADQQLWTSEMMDIVRDWMQNALNAIPGKQDIEFSLQPSRYYLKVVMAKPVIEASDRQRRLFAGFATLAMQALRRSTRKKLRGFKIVLSSKGV